MMDNQQTELWNEFHKLKTQVGLDYAKSQFKIERRQATVRYKALRSNYAPLHLDIPVSVDDMIVKRLQEEKDPNSRNCSFVIAEMTYVAFAQATPDRGVSAEMCVIMDEKEQVYMRMRP